MYKPERLQFIIIREYNVFTIDIDNSIYWCIRFLQIMHKRKYIILITILCLDAIQWN